MTRARTLLLGLLGAALGGFAGQTASGALGTIALAIAAGFGLSLMLRGVGLRVIGTAVALLGLLGCVLSGSVATDGQLWGWVALPGFLAVVAAGVLLFRFGPRWVLAQADRATPPKDLWKQIDEGIDPTDGEDMPTGGDSR
ncbi:Trp biosynthesis-associated membrane protein [Tessaracoccus caeni]|uniref:Trp biosynthesis-associated membrane protein n=1 Tax=Tessaracoccus caeni TaxID=3031239 RepID=UPI0023DC8F25|nr:Trp biosynthesis-associated membrane protein [Tessaracoccus caeni]MDF1489442.1 Trp biosynthesis-associated membrane protein [Tessaracoccus caeni]